MKLAGRIAAVVAVVILCGVTFLTLKKPAQREPMSGKIEATKDRLARGEYLVNHVTDCLACHSQFEFATYGMPHKHGTEGQGGFPFGPEYGVPGMVQAQNITADKETGIGGWTDGEVMRAIREGVTHDGSALFPMMPYQSYRQLSDEDAMAIVVYLRTLPAVNHTIARRELKFPVNFIVKFMPQPLTGPVPDIDDAKDHLAYGQYLVTIAGCRDCHTNKDAHGAPIPGGDFAGGWEMKFPGTRVITSNITPHGDTWMGQASKDEFIGRFRAWAEVADVPAAKGRNTVMGWQRFAGMSEKDLGAIYDYLRTVAPKAGVVNPFPDALPDEAIAKE